ncbi:MAG: hypothetical protein ACOYJA_06645 [Christensenellales bacterium]|jgi:hypothetical protein
MAFLFWLLDHWVPIVIVILVLGTILDCIVYWRKPFFYEPIKRLIARIQGRRAAQPSEAAAPGAEEPFAQTPDAQQIARSMRQENTYVDLNSPEGAVLVPEESLDKLADQSGGERDVAEPDPYGADMPDPAAEDPAAGADEDVWAAEDPAVDADEHVWAAEDPAAGADEHIWAAGARPARTPGDLPEQLTLLPGMEPVPLARVSPARYRLRIIPYDPTVHLRLRVRPRAAAGEQMRLPLAAQEEARDAD